MILADADWPLSGWLTNARDPLREARLGRRSVVLATLVHAEGSTPRPVGSQMVFDGDRTSGYFSGGCIEADIANHAALIIRENKPRHLVYGRGSPWIDIRLLCGGRLEIILEKIGPDDTAVAELLNLGLARKRAGWTSDGRKRTVEEARLEIPLMRYNSENYRLRYDPEWRVIVVGGDPIALAIAQLAAMSGFVTTIIRRDGPQSPSPLQDVRYVRGNAAQAIDAMQPDEWTAVIAATHNDEIDDEVLTTALNAKSAYVGVLGAAHRIGGRSARLQRAGVAANRVAALHAPIGAVRCGKAPWEVAVSVVAEIMQMKAAGIQFPAAKRFPTARSVP